MQFRISIASADFEVYIKSGIREPFHSCALSYSDDILIYGYTEEEHVQHVKWVIQHLLDAGLYLKLEKCELHKLTMK